MPKTTIEKIETLQTQIAQLENQKKELIQQKKKDERNARTKRLIERGAILESLIPNPTAFCNEQIKVFLEKTIATDNARKILENLATQDSAAATEKALWEKRPSGAATAEKAKVTGQVSG